MRRKRRSAIRIQNRARKVRPERWRGEPRAKASRFAARFGYEVVFDYVTNPKAYRRNPRERAEAIREFLESSGLRYQLRLETGAHRHVRVKLLLPGDGELLILRLADIAPVFRVYRLVPHKTA